MNFNLIWLLNSGQWLQGNFRIINTKSHQNDLWHSLLITIKLKSIRIFPFLKFSHENIIIRYNGLDLQQSHKQVYKTKCQLNKPLHFLLFEPARVSIAEKRFARLKQISGSSDTTEPNIQGHVQNMNKKTDLVNYGQLIWLILWISLMGFYKPYSRKNAEPYLSLHSLEQEERLHRLPSKPMKLILESTTNFRPSNASGQYDFLNRCTLLITPCNFQS